MARHPKSPPRVGDALLCVAVHRHLSGADQSATFAARGFSTADVERALRIAGTPVADQEADLARAGRVLVALRAPGVTVEQVEVRTRLTDEAPEERAARLQDAGWFDALMHRAPRTFAKPADGCAYDAGRSEFLALLSSAASPVGEVAA